MTFIQFLYQMKEETVLITTTIWVKFIKFQTTKFSYVFGYFFFQLVDARFIKIYSTLRKLLRAVIMCYNNVISNNLLTSLSKSWSSVSSILYNYERTKIYRSYMAFDPHTRTGSDTAVLRVRTPNNTIVIDIKEI